MSAPGALSKEYGVLLGGIHLVRTQKVFAPSPLPMHMTKWMSP